MKVQAVGISMLLAGLLLGTSAAATDNSFSRIMKWRVFPDPTGLAADTATSDVLTPYWESGALGKVDYAEIADNRGQVHVCLTCGNTDPGTLSVFYYSPAGQCRLISHGLASQRQHQTSLTFLPGSAENTALTMIALWRQPPTTAVLAELMLEGHPKTQPMPDLLETRWFTRTTPIRRDPPWQDVFTKRLAAPSGYILNDWPLCIAECNPDQTITEKDCSLHFRGITSFALDQDGTYGYWQLGWDSPLELTFDLAGPVLPSTATLVILAQIDGVLLFGSEAELKVEANKHTLDSTSIPATQLSVAQPISFELSPYLQRGINTVEVGRSTFSGVNWQARRIELWTR